WQAGHDQLIIARVDSARKQAFVRERCRLGIDILDLVFRLERRFGARISRAQFDKLLFANDPPDIRMGELVDFVRKGTAPSGVFDEEMDGDALWPMFQAEVSGALGVDEHEVAKDSWLLRDLVR